MNQFAVNNGFVGLKRPKIGQKEARNALGQGLLHVEIVNQVVQLRNEAFDTLVGQPVLLVIQSAFNKNIIF